MPRCGDAYVFAPASSVFLILFVSLHACIVTTKKKVFAPCQMPSVQINTYLHLTPYTHFPHSTLPPHYPPRPVLTGGLHLNNYYSRHNLQRVTQTGYHPHSPLVALPLKPKHIYKEKERERERDREREREVYLDKAKT